MTKIEIQSEGRRHYITGDTYPIKDAIRAAGCKWDRDRGAWWTGKRETAEGIVSGVQSGAVEAKASFAKLANGDWGVRVAGSAAAGDKVTVAGKYGEKTVTIAAVVETTDRGTLCSIVREPRKSGGARRSFAARGKWTGCSCGSREDSSGQLIYSPRNCKSCNFDGFDN